MQHAPLADDDDGARAGDLAVRVQHGAGPDGDRVRAGELGVLRDQRGRVDGDGGGAREERGAFWRRRGPAWVARCHAG